MLTQNGILYLNRLIVRRNNGQIKATYRNIVI